jgi:hypothetical protein
MVRRDLGNRGSVSLDAAKVCHFARHFTEAIFVAILV